MLWQEERHSDKTRQAFREKDTCDWDLEGSYFSWLRIRIQDLLFKLLVVSEQKEWERTGHVLRTLVWLQLPATIPSKSSFLPFGNIT